MLESMYSAAPLGDTSPIMLACCMLLVYITCGVTEEEEQFIRVQSPFLAEIWQMLQFSSLLDSAMLAMDL